MFIRNFKQELKKSKRPLGIGTKTAFTHYSPSFILQIFAIILGLIPTGISYALKRFRMVLVPLECLLLERKFFGRRAIFFI